MRTAEILARALRIIQDSSYDLTGDLLPLLNEGLEVVAARVRLPDLFTSAELDTAADGDYMVNMPDDFHAHFVQAYNKVSGRAVHVYKSHTQLTLKFPGLTEEGSVTHAALAGSRLYYQPAPQDPETLRVFYYEKPPQITFSGDPVVYDPATITCIPSAFHGKLLVNYICREIFGEIEDGLEGAKVNWNTHNKLFEEGLEQLEEFVGIAQGEPEYVLGSPETEGMGFFSDPNSSFNDDI